MALLSLLSLCRRKYSLRIAVAHVNHGLSKKQNDRHEALARRFSSQAGIPFYSKSIRLKETARKWKRSLEETGRIERYRFFETVAGKTRSHKIATAHTLDDQAETVLLRLSRGSGLRGIAGIPPKRTQGNFEIIRPLILCEKKDLIRFLTEEKIPFGVDKTNRRRAFTRNRVRFDLLPQMEKNFNPQIKEALASLGAASQSAMDYLERAAKKSFKRCVRSGVGKGTVRLAIPALRAFHPAIQREVIFLALLKNKGDLTQICSSHIEAIMEIVNTGKPILETHLPGPLRVLKRGETLEFRI